MVLMVSKEPLFPCSIIICKAITRSVAFIESVFFYNFLECSGVFFIAFPGFYNNFVPRLYVMYGNKGIKRLLLSFTGEAQYYYVLVTKLEA